MPDTTTPNLSLVKPEEGASGDTWGAKWNANADVLDTSIHDLQTGKEPAISRATPTEIKAKAAKLFEADDAWSAVSPDDLGTVSGTIAIDFDLKGPNIKMTANGNITLGATSHLKLGSSGVIEFYHSGAARTITLNSTYWLSAGGGGISLSTSGAGAMDLLGYYVRSDGKICIGVSGLGWA